MGFLPNVKRAEVLFKIVNKVSYVLICQFDGCVFHFIIPDLGKSDPFSKAHFAKDGCNLNFIIVVDVGVDGKVGFHGLNPSCSVSGFSAKVYWQGYFDFSFRHGDSGGQVLCEHDCWI